MPKRRRQKKKDDDEDCQPCRVSVSLGMALNVCKQIDGKKKCDKLADKIYEEKVTPKQVLRMLKTHARKNKDAKSLKKLKTIEKFMARKDEQDKTW